MNYHSEMSAEPRRKYTLQEYFELEMASDARYEYWNGEIFSMSGVSKNHSANTGQDGHFNFPNVPPGSYKMFSWEEIPSGAYQYPDFIRSFEDRGQAITVEPDGSLEKEVRIIPSV